MPRTRRVYIAASFPKKEIAQALKLVLVDIGFEVTSRWLLAERTNISYGDSERFGREDKEDVLAADTLITITGDSIIVSDGWIRTQTRGGRHTEFGIALGANKRLIILGPKEQVFHHMKQVEQVDTEQELLNLLIME